MKISLKISLKMKLTISYVLLSLFLVSSLFVVSNYLLQKKFQSYIINTQENKNYNIVNLVTNEFDENGNVLSADAFQNIGNTALSEGLVLMVNDSNDNQLFCMSDDYSEMCDDMIASMSTHMASIYPNFEGQYRQKSYDIVKNKLKIGSVTLGYYGPFYYNDQDVQFLNVLNKIFIAVAIIFMLIAAVLGYFMANRISKPIRKVIDKTREIEAGDYSDRLQFTSRTNEINQLINSVNTLAQTLERQQISKKRMASDYAHEFRTPLATLQLNLEAMIDGIWEPNAQRLESCREEILRLTRMISDIDKIVKIENESILLEKTKFDLKMVVDQIVLTFQPSIVAKNISLVTQTVECEIYGDKDKIIQVIVNLLSNAIKYTDNGESIKITVNKYSNKAELIVSDTGIGIAEQDLPNIFDNLYRVDKSRNRSTGGSGIGLSVVKAIVDSHGGSISTKSELTKGSEFIVSLPR
ncbi:sensor histidine kinase [[Clostridium] fimetarium]|uniref:histidine kinase n=1 Tax=[Clostridium] fimetarium TaxID=99656 RepID=A0A1I0M8G9_9FIRM|nr:HAMP domain-containing sensor histidine kinase [[Clostridium] fimetarium]SEV84050.1 Signal transduction histidine kinase [[Clostridium] fimetarium]